MRLHYTSGRAIVSVDGNQSIDFGHVRIGRREQILVDVFIMATRKNLKAGASLFSVHLMETTSRTSHGNEKDVDRTTYFLATLWLSTSTWVGRGSGA